MAHLSQLRGHATAERVMATMILFGTTTIVILQTFLGVRPPLTGDSTLCNVIIGCGAPTAFRTVTILAVLLGAILIGIYHAHRISDE